MIFRLLLRVAIVQFFALYGVASYCADQIPTSEGVLKPGDKIELKADLTKLYDADLSDLSANPPRPVNATCAPARTALTIDSITGDTVSLHLHDGTMNILGAEIWKPNLDDISKPKDGYKPCDGAARVVRVGKEYVTYQADLQAVGSKKFGFVWGPLVVPYKFHFSDKSFNGSPSTLAYLGYELSKDGTTISIVGSAGLGVINDSGNKSDTTDSSSKTGSSAALTVAGGLITTFGAGAFRAGVLVGADWEGKGKGYPYEGKPWIALAIGF